MMKIIHTADLHLDSRLELIPDRSLAEERRNELLLCFRNMVAYAVKEGVEAILIAGDLFDVRKISQTARDAVIGVIVNNPDLKFYYLRGNHDEGSFVEEFRAKTGELPENFKTFNESWTSYELIGKDQTKVVISGAEITKRNNSLLPEELQMDENEVNIVMLHGMESDLSGKGDGEIIPLRDYRNKGIDYLALGHIHAPKIATLDARGKYGYSGCPEGRGFDECGSRGFHLITVSGRDLSVEFVPFAKRIVYDLEVDVKDADGSDAVIDRIKETALSGGVRPDDLLKVRLCGEKELDVSFDLTYIKTILDAEFFVFRIKDETKTIIDYDAFAKDASLKGEFVRMIREETEAGNLDEESAAEVIRTGIRMLCQEGKIQGN